MAHKSLKTPNAVHNNERKIDNFPDEDVMYVREMGSTGGKNDSWILKTSSRNARMSYKKLI